MPKTFQLKPPVRDFFFNVYQAGLASPFSDERVQIEQMIAGASCASPQKRIERAIREVRRQLARLGQNGRIDYTRYNTDDGFLVKAGILFDFFYTYRERFDQLIYDQIQALSGSTERIPSAGIFGVSTGINMSVDGIPGSVTHCRPHDGHWNWSGGGLRR